MSADLVELAAFRPTARTPGCDSDDVGKPGLRPVLLTRYRDLSKLRYDYPLILIGRDADDGLVRTLSGVVDAILQEIAPRGVEGERLRKHVLSFEEEVRVLAARGAKGSLTQLWDLAERNLLSRADDDDARKTLSDSLSRARGALRLDGQVIDCDEETPVKVLTHLWTAVETDKAQHFLENVNRLILKLSDIVKADFMKSDEARAPDNLKRSVGTAFEAAFDFEAMSRILGNASPSDLLPENRRQRIRSALSVLRSQRFFAPTNACDREAERGEPYAFVFDSCTRALSAFRDRLPEIVELIKAIAIAELEIENRYKEATHDPFFSRFDENALAPGDLAPFPSYLVCLRDRACDAAEKATLIEVLSSGLPVKVLVQSDDILEELSVAAGQFAFGAKGSQLASMAVGLNDAYVLQSSASYLYQARHRILTGLAYDGPALLSIFSGSSGNTPGLPPYLAAAAAMESRAFPTFTYDPAAGDDWASRFRVSDNPQADADWPIREFLYEDEDHQSVSEDVAFTFVDFVACDTRYAGRFTAVPRGAWHEGMIPVSEFLKRESDGARETVPYVLMIDERNVLQRAIVDDRLIDAARRCRQMWHSLQELGGINSSHATRLLERERELWEQEKERELEELKGRLVEKTEAPAAVAEAVTREPAVEAVVEAPEEPPSDEPYIETPRCTSCDECIEINNKMFVYDENMQAYIADPDAGTYRDLVEAAESCQVCIIHPGKPRNPNEPSLEELIKRAEPFI
ncbi:MAG: ferredoxin [Kiloniellaceae bacterium]